MWGLMGGEGGDAPTTAAGENGGSFSPHTSWRLLQSGVAFLLPFMTRQVIHVSGPEMANALRFKGQFVPQNVYSPRFQLALESVGYGSLLIMINPALNGLEDRGWTSTSFGKAPGAPTSPPSTASALEALGEACPPLASSLDFDAGAGTITPKPRIPASQGGLIAPSLRPHYALDHTTQLLNFSPSLRICAGADPLARAYICMWKGKNRFNIMVDTEESKEVELILRGGGFSAVVEEKIDGKEGR